MGERQAPNESVLINSVLAEWVMRLHRATGLPVLQAKSFLSQSPIMQQIRYVEQAETLKGPADYIHDLLEEDPVVRQM
jgi:hypothetical protein